MPATPASSFVIAVLCMRQHCCIFKFLGYPSLCDTHNGSAACRWWTHLPAPVHPYTAALPQHPQLLQFGCGLWRGKGFGTCSAPWHPAPCCAQRPAAAFGASMVAFIETWAIDTGSCALRQAPGAQLGRAQTCRQPRYRRRPAAMAAWRFSDWYQNNGIRQWQTRTQPSQRETITGYIVLLSSSVKNTDRVPGSLGQTQNVFFHEANFVWISNIVRVLYPPGLLPTVRAALMRTTIFVSSFSDTFRNHWHYPFGASYVRSFSTL